MTAVGNTFFFGWEVSLMQWLQANLSDAAMRVLSAFSFFGEELLLVFLLGFLYWSLNKELGKRVGLNLLMINVWFPMVKNVALRRRPYLDHEGIGLKRLIDPSAPAEDIAAQGYSFPSGHSANAVGMYGSLAAVFRKGWLTAAAIVLPLLVGISRVAVGAHYPTDVIAGWAVGGLIVLLLPRLRKAVRNPYVFYGILLATALPGVFYCRSADYFSGLGLLIGFVAGAVVEEKYVRFQDTRKPLSMALRLIGGGVIYLALNTLLKLPFPRSFLDSGTYGALFVRCARYAVIAFVDFALYPMLFAKVRVLS